MKDKLLGIGLAALVALQSWTLLEIVNLKADVAAMKVKVDILKFQLAVNP
jgi:hypothetical protein